MQTSRAPIFSQKVFLVIVGLSMVIGAIFRFAWLDHKPIHFDESINGWFVQQIWNDGFFHYDPTNFHGPLLFYLFQMAETVFGASVVSFRLVTSLFSFAAVILFWRMGRKNHFWALWVCLLLSVSPASVFFGRSAIHESPFLFFQLILFLGVWQWLSAKRSQGFTLMVLGLAGCLVLKETVAVLVLALIVSYILSALVFKIRWGETGFFKRDFAWSPSDTEADRALFTAFVAVFFYVALFAGFGVYSKGLKDSVYAYLPWLKTGVAGNGHDKSFWYWTELMAANEWATLAGFVVAVWFLVQALRQKEKPSQVSESFSITPFFKLFLGILSLTLWLLYSLIPYKTPWCLISFQWPLLICLGIFLHQQMNAAGSLWKRRLCLVGVGVFWAQSFWVAEGLNFSPSIDLKHPYVYVQSTEELKKFSDLLYQKGNREPASLNFQIQLGTAESWPFPYVLGPFTQLSYQKPTDVIEPHLALLMVDTKDGDFVREKLKGQGYSEFSLSVRDGRDPIMVFFNQEKYGTLFEKFKTN